jgi:hypothetical protein
MPDFRAAIIGAFVYVLFLNIIPRIFTKPTGVEILDDIVMYTHANKSLVVPSAVLVALVVYVANYIDVQVL